MTAKAQWLNRAAYWESQALHWREEVARTLEAANVALDGIMSRQRAATAKANRELRGLEVSNETLRTELAKANAAWAEAKSDAADCRSRLMATDQATSVQLYAVEQERDALREELAESKAREDEVGEERNTLRRQVQGARRAEEQLYQALYPSLPYRWAGVQPPVPVGTILSGLISTKPADLGCATSKRSQDENWNGVIG